MKRILSYILSVFFFISGMTAFAEENVTVLLDNQKIEFDVPPVLKDGRTLVPMRKIYESLGAKVQWVEQAQVVIATRGADVIAMEIGKNIMSVTNLLSGETEEIMLDVPPQLIDSRTLVPVRAISEALGNKVEWDDETRTVIITSEKVVLE